MDVAVTEVKELLEVRPDLARHLLPLAGSLIISAHSKFCKLMKSGRGKQVY